MSLMELIRDPAPFMPHGMCMLWEPSLIWLHLVSDILTALAYYSIPVALFVFARKRQDLVYRWVFVLFALFIAACGTTHVFGAWTLWQPNYVAEGLVKAATAAVSLATAVALWPLLPRALALPSPAQLRAVNTALAQEVRERSRAESLVRETNARLEQRVAERTAALEAANHQLAEVNATLEQRVAERTSALEQAIQALKESEARYAVTFQHTADGVFLLDVDRMGSAHIVDANPSLREILCLETTEPVHGRRLEELLPESLAAAFTPRLAACIADRQPVTFELEGEIGGRHRILYPTLTPVDGADGRVAQIVGTARDVTERRALEAELAQAAKLATLGSMAAGVAHEMSQPLNAIRITAADCAEVLAETQVPEAVDLAYVREGMETVRDQATRMGGIVDQLRLFGRRDGAARLFDPSLPFRRAVALLERHFASSGIRIHCDLPTGLPDVMGQPSQLEQVAINLLSNARDAIEEGRQHRPEPDSERDIIGLSARVEPGRGSVVFQVDDHGIGLDPALAQRVFDPFFTTKEEQKGMGLGLSICSTIVAAMGGRIAAIPLPGGARFEVELPLQPRTVEEMPA